MKIKYYVQRKRRDGSINHMIGVPAYVEAVTGDTSKSFDTLEEAKAYSLEVQSRYAAHARNDRKKRTLDKSTVQALVHFYRSTEDYYNLKPNSTRSYDAMISAAMDIVLPGSKQCLGAMKAANITKDTVRQVIHFLRENKSQHRALHTVKVMRLVWTTAENHDRIKGNPWRNPKIKSLPDRKVIWTDAQVKLFIDTADDMGLHSLGTMTMMCYHMCQRPGDVRQLRWDDLHITDGYPTFIFPQEKTGTEVFVPLTDELQKRLELHRSTKHNSYDTILICEVNGKPYDRWIYAKLARRVRDKAKLPSELRIADLRRTGTTKLANSGCTEDELMSVTGHTSRQIVSTYVKRSQILARGAIGKAWS